MIKTNEVSKIVAEYNKGGAYQVGEDDFIYHARRYIKAIKAGRMLCKIESVAPSGMSRVIKFEELNKGQVLNFYQFFMLLGYTRAKNSDGFRVSGCGMDMIFHTNYSIIHRLHRLGFITRKQCAELAQKMPHII